MGTKVSYTSFDYEPVYTVPVIASFDAEGHIKPLYVRVNEDRYKVFSYWVKNHFSNIIEFNCQLQKGDRLIPALLKYHQQESVWTIPRCVGR
ncbi:MAG: hypothetical protein K5641_03530 [Lachnospiraceae bacterium]|nr:hypothetical protein [Lachnospiraceae bacterium]